VQTASVYGYQSTRHMVNSSHSQLITGQLVTRSTRHKEAVNSSQTNKQTTKPYCRTSIITLTRIVHDRRRYEKIHKKLGRNQSEQQSTRSVLLTARLGQEKD